MNERIEHRKQRSERLINSLKKFFAILFCIALLIFSISIADISTRRMIMCNDDKYAMAVSLQGDNLIRLDIAGEKLMIDIGPAVRMADYIVSGSKKYYGSFVKFIKAKLGK